MSRLFIYVRVSSEGQRDNTSPEDQVRKGQAVASYNELDVAGVYQDLAVSGTVPFTERPEGAKLWSELREGDVICVSKLDRAFRSAEDALITSRKLKERGVDLIAADLSVEPLTKDGVGKLIFGLMAQFAEFERERIAERLQMGMKSKKARGGFGGGRRPFGYDIKGEGRESVLVPNPAEQKAIEAMRIWHAVDGYGTRVISDLVKRDFGLSVSHVTVAKILKQLAEQEKKA